MYVIIKKKLLFLYIMSFLNLNQDPINIEDYYLISIYCDLDFLLCKIWINDGFDWIELFPIIENIDGNNVFTVINQSGYVLFTLFQSNQENSSYVSNYINENLEVVNQTYDALKRYYIKLSWDGEKFIYTNISENKNFFVICFAGNSKIKTFNKKTELIEYVCAKNLDPTLHLVYSCNKNKFIPFYINFVSGPTQNFILIKKDLLGENMPLEDLYITSSHPIIIDNKEIISSKIKGAKKTKLKMQYVYTIVSKNREPININNLNVLTWEYDSFIKKIKN
jgi:hypothetical protein